MHHPKDRITHTMAFGTPVVENWLDREIAQWAHNEGSLIEAESLDRLHSQIYCLEGH